jgi:hypothetical protein
MKKNGSFYHQHTTIEKTTQLLCADLPAQRDVVSVRKFMFIKVFYGLVWIYCGKKKSSNLRSLRLYKFI